MSARGRWIGAIVGLLGANAIAATVLVVSARAGAGGAQVLPAYYDRAARFDEELAQRARNRALGWRAAVAVGPARELEVDVRDAAGAPVRGARVRLDGHHRAHAAERLERAATEAAPGHYRAAALPRAGRHDLSIEIERGGDRFVVRAMVEVP